MDFYFEWSENKSSSKLYSIYYFNTEASLSFIIMAVDVIAAEFCYC